MPLEKDIVSKIVDNSQRSLMPIGGEGKPLEHRHFLWANYYFPQHMSAIFVATAHTLLQEDPDARRLKFSSLVIDQWDVDWFSRSIGQVHRLMVGEPAGDEHIFFPLVRQRVAEHIIDHMYAFRLVLEAMMRSAGIINAPVRKGAGFHTHLLDEPNLRQAFAPVVAGYFEYFEPHQHTLFASSKQLLVQRYNHRHGNPDRGREADQRRDLLLSHGLPEEMVRSQIYLPQLEVNGKLLDPQSWYDVI